MDLIGPLLPARFRPYAKAWLAAVGTVLAVLALTLTDVTWLPLAVNILTALGVYAQPNSEVASPLSADEAF